MKVHVARDLHAAIIDHAVDGLPNEACGLLAGTVDEPTGTLTAFYPIRNADESPTTFTLDPYEHIAAENDADARDLLICGVMHSHPTSEAWPSATDIAAVARFDPAGNWVNVIVSLHDDEAVVRAFRIVDGQIVEVAIDIGTATVGR